MRYSTTIRLRLEEINSLHSNDLVSEENLVVLNTKKSKIDKFRDVNKVYIGKESTSACSCSTLRLFIK